MASVTFPPAVGGDGSTVSDDASPTTGLANGGHRIRFVPALAQLVAIATFVVQKAADAAAAAASALGGVGSIATSTTSLTIGAGDQVLDVGLSKTFAAGQKVGIARTSDALNSAMYGTVKTYAGSTLTVTIPSGNTIGSGTFSDWTVSPTLYGPASSRSISASGLATGGGDLSADRTITVTAAAAADVRAGTSLTTAVTPKALVDSAAPQTLSYGSTVSWDVALGYNAYLTLAGNPIISAPTNLKDGIPITLFLDQGSAGNRTITSWASIYDWGSAGAPTLSTGANKVDIVSGIYSATTGKVHMSFRKAA